MVDKSFEAGFAWLGLAFFIDGIDGTFARAVGVKERLPRFSGEVLDLVVDYATYVFVPVLALQQSGLLDGWLGQGLAAAILLSSLFHFSDTLSKDADNHFVGFPAIWNIVAFYVLAFGLGQAATALVVATAVMLTFVPWRWVHPLRVTELRWVTIAATVAWSLAAISAVAQGFPVRPIEGGILLAVAVYGLGLSLMWRLRFGVR
jgi:phosphatidylcholine synthase